ncbi:pentapeptide repeat-containing protein [Rhizobium rhizogenes]|uniref:pentapeptide repeat-containing protein n=1 Tax=Rhizobium rhizogenes TaxID=359 RepID=UPI0015735CE3|nr:pentapeptide repeat-containing protein [Rhizobium rhizogenes]NTG07200.1 pentapeptide repeat-containing protein [Rhizobium rhizogenes]
MKIEIKSRWDDTVLYTAEVEADENTPNSILLRLAVLAAMEAKANLSSADLRSADLSSANLSYANLSYANLSYADLSYADLRSADLSSANLRSANLSYANLSYADLSYADLRSADLSSANLSYANLSYADLSSANLSYANLSYANLSYANLSYADLSYADLSSANLSYANLSYANLRSFKADLWMTLTQNRHEVPALVAALRDGRVDGSTYEGDCACLVGTIANAKDVSYEVLDHGASNPAEQWFAMIRKGDKPEDDSAGGFASKMALEWATEWCVLNEIAVDTAEPVAAD